MSGVGEHGGHSAENDASKVRVPVQGETTNDPRGYRPRGSVEWWEHVEAWNEYHRHHSEQSALRIAERGGFGYWEMFSLLQREPVSWRAGEVPRPTRINGHGVVGYGRAWRCVRCYAYLLTLMQFRSADCPGRVIPPAVPTPPAGEPS